MGKHPLDAVGANTIVAITDSTGKGGDILAEPSAPSINRKSLPQALAFTNGMVRASEFTRDPPVQARSRRSESSMPS